MSDLLDEEPEGATPLTPEEREGLIPAQVTLRRELNELEQENILEASLWVTRRSRDPVSDTFARNLHRRMFGQVWRWAGANRASNKNIGCDWWDIDLRLRGAFDDARTWIASSSYPADEIAVRFHHRLVAIHPFANGNGRWSRLMGDTLGEAAWQACLQLGQQQPAGRRCDAARLHRRLARGRPARHRPAADLRPVLGREGGERLAVTLGPAAQARLLRARPCGRCAPPAARRRVPPCSTGRPVRRLPAAFILSGALTVGVRRDCHAGRSPISRRRGVGCSGHCSVPGVMDRLKGRRGPTIFLAEEPKKS